MDRKCTEKSMGCGNPGKGWAAGNGKEAGGYLTLGNGSYNLETSTRFQDLIRNYCRPRHLEAQFGDSTFRYSGSK